LSRRTFFIFGLIFAFLAVLIPVWAIDKEGASTASPEHVPATLEEGKELFAVNCGNCHTLARAGTDGDFAPNLDELLAGSPPEATKQRVLGAIENGLDSPTPGRMPAGIVSGEQADKVAEFVAQEAGK
jgi:mono/diheme cytochrome c family protein